MAKKKTKSAAKTNDASTSKTLADLKQLFADENEKQQDLNWCWSVGQLVERLQPRAAPRSYGKNLMTKLAEQLRAGGSSDLPDRLRRMRDFARYFTKDEAAAWANRQRQDGQPITWSYVRPVLAVDDHETQLSLLERCVAENMTTAKLLASAQKQKGGKRKGGGRRPDMPASTDDALAKTVELANKFENWCQSLEAEGSDAKANKSPLDRWPIKLRRLLEHARAALTAFRDQAEETRLWLPEKETKAAKTKTAKAKPAKAKHQRQRLPRGQSMLRGW